MRADERVVADGAHTEGLRSEGDFAADAAEAEDGEGFAVDFGAPGNGIGARYGSLFFPFLT